jgi:hypothetical protein
MFERHIALFAYSQWMALGVHHLFVPIASESGHGVDIDFAHVHGFDIPVHAVDLPEVEAAHFVKPLFWA